MFFALTLGVDLLLDCLGCHKQRYQEGRRVEIHSVNLIVFKCFEEDLAREGCLDEASFSKQPTGFYQSSKDPAKSARHVMQIEL